MSEPTLLILAIVLALAGNGFFSGSEIAILSARMSRIEALVAKGSKGAARVKALRGNMESFLATVQIGVTVMGTLAGVFGGYLASRHLEPAVNRVLGGLLPASLGAGALVGLTIVYVELILGELVPKAIALRFTETVAMLAAWPLTALARVSGVLVRLLTASTRAVLLLFGIRDARHSTFVSEEEIKHLAKEASEQGVMEPAQAELLHRVLEFTETPVRKVMVPRPKVFALDADTEPAEVARLMVESGFSRIPVYEGSIDNVIGLVYGKDALRLLEKRQPVVLRKITHPVLFVPETKQAGPLLQDLQKRRTHMAMVIDEHGSVSGLVTLEDLIEEIVGEIQDEYDWEERPIEKLRDGALVVEGTVPAAVLRQEHAVPIPESPEFETVAGYLLDTLGTVPKGGESVELGEFRLTVVDVEKNRISKVRIEKVVAPAVAG